MTGFSELFIAQKNLEIPKGIYHNTQIEFAYQSTRLEGGSLSREQIAWMYETKTLEGPAFIYDIIETQNHFRLFNYMIATVDEPLSEALIKMYHKILKNNHFGWEQPEFKVGVYKNQPNQVGGLSTPSPDQVPSKMKELITYYNRRAQIRIEDIVDFHYKFEGIHPFQSGNGKIGRMLLFKECLRHDLMPIIIEEEQKMMYYGGLRKFNLDRSVLTETCILAQKRYLAFCEAQL